VKSTTARQPGNQLWGIYHTDREYAREHGDPLRTVIEAPTKLAAVLKSTPKAVESRLYRARQLLREKLKKWL